MQINRLSTHIQLYLVILAINTQTILKEDNFFDDQIKFYHLNLQDYNFHSDDELRVSVIFKSSNIDSPVPFIYYCYEGQKMVFDKQLISSINTTNCFYDLQNVLFQKLEQYFTLTRVNLNKELQWKFKQFTIQNENLTLALYNPSGSNKNLKFGIRVQIFGVSNKTCIKNCNSNGQCLSKSNVCACSKASIGAECQDQTIKLVYPSLTTMNFLGQSSKIYSLNLQNISLSGKISLTAQNDNKDLQCKYYCYWSVNYYGALKQGCDENSIKFHEKKEENILIDWNVISECKLKTLNISSFLETSLEPLLLFEFYNPSTSQAKLLLQIDVSDSLESNSNNLIILIFGIIGGIVSLLIIICCMKRYYQRNDQRRVPQKLSAPSDENYESYLPSKDYLFFVLEYPQIIEQNQCSICLSDFSENKICRLTICIHIYHKNCIDKWLQSHQTCPSCRKSHKIEDIKEHIRLENQKPKTSTSPQILNQNNQLLTRMNWMSSQNSSNNKDFISVGNPDQKNLISHDQQTKFQSVASGNQFIEQIQNQQDNIVEVEEEKNVVQSANDVNVEVIQFDDQEELSMEDRQKGNLYYNIYFEFNRYNKKGKK